MTIDELENLLLQLPQPERARLAERLIASLDEESELEKTWYDEAERRLAEFESGQVEGVSAEEVFSALQARLKE